MTFVAQDPGIYRRPQPDTPDWHDWHKTEQGTSLDAQGTIGGGSLQGGVIITEQGIKDKNSKLDYSEINLELLDIMAERMMANKNKYPAGNSKKVIPIEELAWAAFRHIRKMLQPVKNDPETVKDHVAAVGCNMSMILDQLNRLKNN